jgi:hypothetical protein
MSTKTTLAPINLPKIALLLLSSDRIKEQVTELGLVFTAKQLNSKKPELKPLEDLPLIQLRKTATGNNYRTLCLYQKEGEVVIVLPDINATIAQGFEIKEWKAGDVNQAVIVSQKDNVALNVAIAFTDYALDEIRSSYDNLLEGEGIETLKADWLRDAPEIELPLRELPIGVKLTVVGNSDRRSKKYNTLLVDIKDSDGKLYKNVLTNTDLRSLIAANCQEFKITSVIPTQVKNEYPRSKEKTRTIHKVFLEPIDSTDFSDF